MANNLTGRYENGLSVEWLQVNQAYLVTWHHFSTLSILNTAEDLEWYLIGAGSPKKLEG